MKNSHFSTFSIKKISSRIILVILLCTIITSMTVGMVSLRNGKEAVKVEALSNIQNMAKAYANKFSRDFVKIEMIGDNLEHLITSQFDINKLKIESTYLEEFKMSIEPIVKEIAQESSFANSAYIYFNPDLIKEAHDLYFIDHDGDGEVSRQAQTPISSYQSRPDDGSMEWWFKPIEEKIGIWTDPYIWEYDDGTSDLFISYTKPVFIEDELIAVVGTDFLFEDMVHIVNNLTVYDNGYAYVLNDNEDAIVHPVFKNNENFRDIEDGKYKWFADRISNNESDVIEYTWIDGKDKITAFAKISNGWTLGIAPPLEEILKKSNEFQDLLTLLIIISAVVSALVAYVVGKFISNPITLISKHLQHISTGDFTNSLLSKIIERNDEIGILGKSINTMQDNIKSLISNSKKTSYEAKEASEVLASTSEQSSDSIEEVSVSLSEVALGSSEQAKDAESAVSLVIELNNTFEILNTNTKEMVHAVQKIMDENLKGVDALNELKNKNKFTNSSISRIENATIELSDKSQNIDNILETINSIAEQTNLLALNASIEAARAGEAGKGFAVVANEIRNLAEESRKSTDQIRNIVEQIKAQSTNNTEIMLEVKNNSEEQTKSVEDVNCSFNNISKSIDEISDKIKLLSKSMEATEEIKNGLVSKIESVSSVSEQIAAATEEVSTSVQEQSISMEQVSKLANELSEVANRIKDSINVFKI